MCDKRLYVECSTRMVVSFKTNKITLNKVRVSKIFISLLASISKRKINVGTSTNSLTKIYFFFNHLIFNNQYQRQGNLLLNTTKQR